VPAITMAIAGFVVTDCINVEWGGSFDTATRLEQ
jgi:hypothetical protein